MQVYTDFSLQDILWYKIGGTAKYFLNCENREDIIQALKFVKANNVGKVFVCGQGSNLIFASDYFNGAVIHITKSRTGTDIIVNEGGEIEAFAGESLDSVITFALDNGLVGLEWAGGLPGTVGAAIRGNVGAYGGEIKDTVLSADVLDYATNEILFHLLTNEQLQFVYRGSFIKTNRQLVVAAARFNLRRGNDAEIAVAREIYTKNIQTRRERHPLEYPNCGSVFKNIRDREQIDKVLSIYPEFTDAVTNKWYGKVAAASLIERIGFKGYRVGNAQVSEKHALFIVNLGNAKAKDVLRIIDDIQKKFQHTFGFQLETEVEIVQ